MLVSIISSVLGLLMDGDISWVMDILISLRFFFSPFVSWVRVAQGGNPMRARLLASYRNFPQAENQFVAGRMCKPPQQSEEGG